MIDSNRSSSHHYSQHLLKHSPLGKRNSNEIWKFWEQFIRWFAAKTFQCEINASFCHMWNFENWLIFSWIRWGKTIPCWPKMALGVLTRNKEYLCIMRLWFNVPITPWEFKRKTTVHSQGIYKVLKSLKFENWFLRL